jgi:queuine tRNA-ribosyltransferase
MKTFEILQRCPKTRARLGRIHTPHGPVDTPVFAPVGTQASVKTLLSEDLEKMGVQLILGNTYHLYLRPGMEIIEIAGGLHRFMSWDRAILTDSGGYQVFSLEQLRKISDDGVEFQSHIDGSRHYFTPEKAIEIQKVLGSDIVMCFDECAPYPCEESHAKEALERTTRWARRCKEAFYASPLALSHGERVKGVPSPLGEGAGVPRRLGDHAGEAGALLYAIAQGSIFPHLRKESIKQLVDLDFPGYAIGGLSVGEPQEAMHEMVALSTELLPEDKPRYLMGVGTPIDLWEAVGMGIDQFDCVLPTRNGRNGQLFTSEGKLNLKNAPYKDDFGPVDAECDCDLCKRYTRAYLHHLFRAGELSALRLASLHNVAFLIRSMRQIRAALERGTFLQEKQIFLEKYRRS